MRLYELPQAIRDLVARAVDPETGEIDASMESALDALHEEFGRKVEWIGLLVREAEAEAGAWKAEEDRLKRHRQAAENRADRLTAYLLGAMTDAEVDRVDGERCTVRLQASPPSVEYMGEEIPDEYRVVSVRLDARKALDAHKAGRELPDGFRVTQANHVRVQ